MERTSIYVGLVLRKNDNTLWRIIYVGTNTVLIEMNVDNTNLIIANSFELKNNIANRDYTVATENEQGKFFLDVDALTSSQKADYEKKKAFIEEFKKAYGPDYIEFCSKTRNYTFTALYVKYEFSHTLAYRIVRRWLQSGMQDGSWLDPRIFTKMQAQKKRRYFKKTGKIGVLSNGIPLTSELKEHFDYGISLYKKIRNMSKTDSYRVVIQTFYSTPNEDGSRTLYEEGHYPTLRQYLYYLSTQLSEMDIKRIKTSNDEFNNSCRMLSGFNRESAIKPGYILEADAVEVDFHTVSSFNNQQNISKPVVYMLADLYSHAIVACHVSYDNNDMVALSSLMMNLFEDKSLFLEAHNITDVDLSYWPSMFIPHEIRCDRGSDFASDKFSEICQTLNISRKLEHGATGSMKGLIERSFGQFQSGLRPFLEDKGIVQYKYDSKHQQQACMTLEHVLELVVMFIIEHNRHFFEKWKLTPEMRNAGVEKTPISVWNYGIEYEGATEQISPHNYMHCLFALMPKGTATLTREGVKFKDLIYRVPENSLLEKRCIASQVNGGKRDSSGNRLNSIEIRYDPRSIDNIYYLEGKKIHSLINAYDKNGQHKHCTWEDYAEMRAIDSKNAINGRRNNLEDSINRIESITKLAKTAHIDTYANTNDINKWRKLDKNAVNYENRIETKIHTLKENEAMSELIDSDKKLQTQEPVKEIATSTRKKSSSELAFATETRTPKAAEKKEKHTSKKKSVTFSPTVICPEELCDFD